jgi:hypothetical protein
MREAALRGAGAIARGTCRYRHESGNECSNAHRYVDANVRGADRIIEESPGSVALPQN